MIQERPPQQMMTSPTSSEPQRLTIGVLALQGAFIEHIHYLHKIRIDGYEINAIPIRSAADLALCSALIVPGGESTVMARLANSTPHLLDPLLSFVRDPLRPVWGTCAGMILMAGPQSIGGGKIGGSNGAVDGWGGMPGLKVWRNLYGGQLESFEYPLQIRGIDDPNRPFNAIFIRAPAVHSIASVENKSRDVGTTEVMSTTTVLPSLNAPPTPPLTPSPSHPHIPSLATTNSTTIRPLVPLATLPPTCTPPPPPSDTPLGASDPTVTSHVMLRQGRKMVTSFHPELSGDIRVHKYWVEHCVLGKD